MKINKIVSTTAIFIFLSISAQAKDFSYKYLEAGYLKYNDVEDIVDSAFDIKASQPINDKVYVILNYSKINFKPVNIKGISMDMGISEAEIGLGYHTPIIDKTDLTVGASALVVKKEGTVNKGSLAIAGSESELGFGLELGTRHHITDAIEANFKATYKNIFNAKTTADEFGVTLGGRYHINDSLSAGISLSTSTEDGDPEIITSSLRWSTL